MRPLVWQDSEDGGASFAPTPEFGSDDHGQPSGYRIVGSLWWFHPSFDAPTCVGGWDGDLTPAKEAAEAIFKERLT